jgi:type II secretory pathway pseudopilin PulG
MKLQKDNLTTKIGHRGEAGVTIVELLVSVAVASLVITAGVQLFNSSVQNRKLAKNYGSEDDLRSFVDKAFDCATLISLNSSICDSRTHRKSAKVWAASLSCEQNENPTALDEASVNSRYKVKAKCRHDGDAYLFDFYYQDNKSQAYANDSERFLYLFDTPVICRGTEEEIVNVPLGCSSKTPPSGESSPPYFWGSSDAWSVPYQNGSCEISFKFKDYYLKPIDFTKLKSITLRWNRFGGFWSNGPAGGTLVQSCEGAIGSVTITDFLSLDMGQNFLAGSMMQNGGKRAYTEGEAWALPGDDISYRLNDFASGWGDCNGHACNGCLSDIKFIVRKKPTGRTCN